MHRLSLRFLLALLVLASCIQAQSGPPRSGASPRTVLELATAEAILLEAWDDARTLPTCTVAKADRPSLAWLEGNLRGSAPSNPFKAGRREFREAEAMRTFLGQGGPVNGLSLRLLGSQAALWRWGATRARAGAWAVPERQAWEDRLTAPDVHFLFREYALRHALCFALAEQDEARFTELRERWGDQVSGLFPSFQRAFALLGAPLPVLRVFGMPDLRPQDESLGTRYRHLRIEGLPKEGALAALPKDQAWLLPTQRGTLPLDEADLDPESLQEAQALKAHLPADATGYYLAPCRDSLETHALVLFPVLVDLDEAGRVTKIQMGDAARAAKKP